MGITFSEDSIYLTQINMIDSNNTLNLYHSRVYWYQNWTVTWHLPTKWWELPLKEPTMLSAYHRSSLISLLGLSDGAQKDGR